MLRQKMFSLVVISGLVILSQTGRISAQQAATAAKAAPQPDNNADNKSQSLDKPTEQYHLELSINELEDGKKINSRQYSTNLATNEGNELKIATRVPVDSKEGEFQYLDVGEDIFSRVSESKGQMELTVRAEVSSFAQPGEKADSHPIVRQMKMGGTALLPAPKTFVLCSVDDPNSKRQYQLEVTVTKLR